MKKPKIPQKLPVEIILHKFYTISCFDANTGLPIFFSGNFIPDEEDDSKEYRYEEENGTDFDRFDLGSHFDVLQKVYLENFFNESLLKKNQKLNQSLFSSLRERERGLSLLIFFSINFYFIKLLN